MAGQTVSVVSRSAARPRIPWKSHGAAAHRRSGSHRHTGTGRCGDTGALRVRQAKRALTHTDIAVMVIDAVAGVTPEDRKILQQLEQRHIPTIQVWNKCDQATPRQKTPLRSAPPPARNPGTQGGTGQVLSKAAHRTAICPPVRQPAPTGGRGASGHSH
ncbi:MAG: GTP-binding protein [Ruminococcus callidus]